jgi:hypothetical protein
VYGDINVITAKPGARSGVFGIFAAWYEGDWLRVARVWLVAVGLVALATRHSKSR